MSLPRVSSPQTTPTPIADLGGLSETLYYDIQKAYSLGLINGVSATSFAPASSLTREQVSTILFRIYAKLGGKADTSNANLFADDAGISTWAKDAVCFMASKGILNGVGNNNFAPKNNTQAQQALIIASRMLEALA